MFNILSQITLKVKYLRNEEQHCLLPSLVDDFTCVHSKNALLTHILSTLFSSTSVLFSCAPFGTNLRKTKLSVTPGHRTVQEGLGMVSCRKGITKCKHVFIGNSRRWPERRLPVPGSCRGGSGGCSGGGEGLGGSAGTEVGGGGEGGKTKEIAWPRSGRELMTARTGANSDLPSAPSSYWWLSPSSSLSTATDCPPLAHSLHTTGGPV